MFKHFSFHTLPILFLQKQKWNKSQIIQVNSVSILKRILGTNSPLGTGNNEPLVSSSFSWTESLPFSREGWQSACLLPTAVFSTICTVQPCWVWAALTSHPLRTWYCCGCGGSQLPPHLTAGMWGWNRHNSVRFWEQWMGNVSLKVLRSCLIWQIVRSNVTSLLLPGWGKKAGSFAESRVISHLRSRIIW